MDLKNLLKNGENGNLTTYDNIVLSLLPLTLYKKEIDMDSDIDDVLSILQDSSGVNKPEIIKQLKELMDDVKFYFPKKTEEVSNQKTIIYKVLENFSNSLHYIHDRVIKTFVAKSTIENKIINTINNCEKEMNCGLEFFNKNHFAKGTRYNKDNPKKPKEVKTKKLDELEKKAIKNKKVFLYDKPLEEVIVYALLPHFGISNQEKIIELLDGYNSVFFRNINNIKKDLIITEIEKNNFIKSSRKIISDKLKDVKQKINMPLKLGKDDFTIMKVFNETEFLNDVLKGIIIAESQQTNKMQPVVFKDYVETILTEVNNLLNDSMPNGIKGVNYETINNLINETTQEYSKIINGKKVDTLLNP